MKLPFCLVALLLWGTLLRADIVIVQNVESTGKTGQITIKVSGDKVREDVGAEVSTIIDTTTGEATTIMHAQKIYMVITPTQAKAMLAGAAGTSGTASVPVPKATGRTDKINGYNAAEYASSTGNIKNSIWISTDFPNAKVVSQALAMVRKGALADMAKTFSPDMSTLPGVPIKVETEFNGQKITTELVSAAEQPVDPSEFKVPAGYSQMSMPTPNQ